jgi:hypothetical protein
MANAAFTLKKRKDWAFALEDEPKKIYTLPALSGLSYEEAERMKKIGSMTDITEQGPLIKEFILSYAPDLKEKDLGDMEYYEIFNAYGISEGKEKLGESAASQSS